MDDTQNVVSDSVESAEITASESANTEQTPETNVDTSAEKLNTETTEGEGLESKEDLSQKTVPYYALKAKVDRINQLESELATFKNQPQPVTHAPSDDGDAQQMQLAKQALDKLNVADRSYVESFVKEEIQSALAQDRVYREMDAQAQTLSKEWDGANGRPKFDVDQVVEYGKSVGVYDLKTAFELMNAKPLAEYYARQAKSGLKSERAGKPVQNVGADEDALRKEAIETGDFTKLLKIRLKK